jgi:hypothetical protein
MLFHLDFLAQTASCKQRTDNANILRPPRLLPSSSTSSTPTPSYSRNLDTNKMPGIAMSVNQKIPTARKVSCDSKKIRQAGHGMLITTGTCHFVSKLERLREPSTRAQNFPFAVHSKDTATAQELKSSKLVKSCHSAAT